MPRLPFLDAKLQLDMPWLDSELTLRLCCRHVQETPLSHPRPALRTHQDDLSLCFSPGSKAEEPVCTAAPRLQGNARAHQPCSPVKCAPSPHVESLWRGVSRWLPCSGQCTPVSTGLAARPLTSLRFICRLCPGPHTVSAPGALVLLLQGHHLRRPQQLGPSSGHMWSASRHGWVVSWALLPLLSGVCAQRHMGPAQAAGQGLLCSPRWEGQRDSTACPLAALLALFVTPGASCRRAALSGQPPRPSCQK